MSTTTTTAEDQAAGSALMDASEEMVELIELGNLLHFAILGLREHCRGLDPSAADFDAMERGSILLRAKGRQVAAMLEAAQGKTTTRPLPSPKA